MGSEQLKKMGASGRLDLPLVDPEKLVIVEDESHPLYDPRATIEPKDSFVENIMTYGILQPVVVRANGEHEDGSTRLEVVAGRQRVKAARRANKILAMQDQPVIRVPIVFRRGDDKTVFGALLSENDQRFDREEIERAKMMARMLDMGGTEKDVVIATGLSLPAVKYHLALLDCTKEVQRAVESKKIGLVLAAKEIARLPREKQNDALAALIAEGMTKGEAAKDAVRALRNGKSLPQVDKAERGHKKKRVRSRLVLERWKRGLAKVDRRDGKIAQAVIAYVLGNDRALAPYPALKAALEEVSA